MPARRDESPAPAGAGKESFSSSEEDEIPGTQGDEYYYDGKYHYDGNDSTIASVMRENERKQRQRDHRDFFFIRAGLLLYSVIVLKLTFWEFADGCQARALALAVENHQELSCTGDLASFKAVVGGYGPEYLSCPLDNSSLPTWTPAHFGAPSLAKAFSVRAVAVYQEASIFQCVEEIEKNGWAHYSLKWSTTYASGADFVGASSGGSQQNKRAYMDGCGPDFAGNPALPDKMASATKQVAALTIAGGKIDLSEHLGLVEVTQDIQIDPQAARYFWAAFKKKNPTHNWVRGRLLKDGTQLASCDEESPHIGCLRLSYKQSTVERMSVLAALALRPSIPAEGVRISRQPPEVFEPLDWEAPRSVFCPYRDANLVKLIQEGETEAGDLRTARRDLILRISGVLMVAVAWACLGYCCFIFALGYPISLMIAAASVFLGLGYSAAASVFLGVLTVFIANGGLMVAVAWYSSPISVLGGCSFFEKNGLVFPISVLSVLIAAASVFLGLGYSAAASVFLGVLTFLVPVSVFLLCLLIFYARSMN